MPKVIWLTGLSGSGKTTIATDLQIRLTGLGIHSTILDGDSLRTGLNKDLGFSRKDREENIRRAGEVSALLAKTGCLVIASFISPYKEGRNFVRGLFQKNDFIEAGADLVLPHAADILNIIK